MTRKSGANFGLRNGVGPSGAKLVPGQNRRVDIMAETGLFADGKKGIQRVSDPHLRAKDMDRDGVDGVVFFGVLGTASEDERPAGGERMLDPAMRLAGWFWSHYPDRHIGLGCIPMRRPSTPPWPKSMPLRTERPAPEGR